jgi:hypothetical protein
LAVTGYDSPFKNIVCNIASNKKIETREFYIMNENISSDYTKRYNKSKVTLHYRKCEPDTAIHQDPYIVNSNDTPPLVHIDKYLYVEEQI